MSKHFYNESRTLCNHGIYTIILLCFMDLTFCLIVFSQVIDLYLAFFFSLLKTNFKGDFFFFLRRHQQEGRLGHFRIQRRNKKENKKL